jgi:hypothetical protein
MEQGMSKSVGEGLTVALALLVAVIALLSGCGRQAEPSVENFLDKHWAEPCHRRARRRRRSHRWKPR